MNTTAEQTQASIKCATELLEQRHAQLWINHYLPQSKGLRYAPQSYH